MACVFTKYLVLKLDKVNLFNISQNLFPKVYVRWEIILVLRPFYTKVIVEVAVDIDVELAIIGT